MPTVIANKEYNTFIKGIITEANPLSFPENASIDESNFILNRNGSRQRRLGMDYEAGYALIDTGYTSGVFDSSSVLTYRWDNAGNDISISIGIIFIYGKYWFLDLSDSSPSSSLLNSGNYIDAGFQTAINSDISFATLQGAVYVATGDNLVTKLEYNPTSDLITKSEFSLKIRDTFGVDDGLVVDTRPFTDLNTHRYNLFNQGWDSLKQLSFFTLTGGYPSNADIWTVAKDSDDNFSVSLLLKQFFGKSPAPNGHFILDAMAMGTSRFQESGTPGLPHDSFYSGHIAITSAFGRLFYAQKPGDTLLGDDLSPDFSTLILFSQITNNGNNLEKCFQEADPTSEHISDIIDTDGGIISIPSINNILQLDAYSNGVLLFAENGIWFISGGEANFTATSYSVTKVSDIGVASKQSIVKTEDSYVYWSKAGIYLLSANEFNKIIVKNITENTIQTLYSEIPSVGKANSIGTFDSFSRKISWLYNDDYSYDGILQKQKYNKELILDLVLGAFYKNDIKELSSDSPYVAGYLTTPSFQSSVLAENVLVNGEQVQVNGEDVVVTSSVRSTGLSQTKYLVVKPPVAPSTTYSITLGLYRDFDFKDWVTDDSVGVDANAYLITGYDTLQDTMRNKSTSYVFFHFNRTETGFQDIDGELEAINPSSCFVQARWDFSDQTNSGKWGTAFQAYRLKRDYIPSGVDDTFDYGQSVITSKSRLRGNGRSLSLNITTEENKGCYLYGWAISFKGRSRI